MKIIVLLFLLVGIVYSQSSKNNSLSRGDSLSTSDSVGVINKENSYKLAIFDIKTDDNEFGSLFEDKLYSQLNIISHKTLKKKYYPIDITLKKNWYNIADKEKINYILFLTVESPKVKCTSNCLLFFSKVLVKDVKINVKIYSVDERKEVYTGIIESSYAIGPKITLKNCSNILVNVNEMKLYYNKAYELAVKKTEELIKRMGIYKENYYER